MKSRKLFYLLTGIYTLTAGYAFAQQTILRNEPANIGAVKMSTPVIPGGATGNKTTSLQSRLVGVTNTTHNGAFYEVDDSTAYKYGDNRGGDLMSVYLKFDNGQDWTYNPGTGSFKDNMRYFQSFDTRNNILTTTYEVWDISSSSWKNDHKYLYTYDPSNNMTGYIAQNWSTSTNSWVNSYHYLYSYDSKNNMLTQIYQTWITSSESWRNENKYTYTYNDKNEYLSKLFQFWNTSSNVWANQDQQLYTYDSLGNILTDISMYWSTSGGGSWRNDTKITYLYNSNNNPVSRLAQDWNSFGLGSWYNNNQHLYTYDTTVVNNMVKEVYQTWGSGWTNNEQVMYTYDGAGNRLTEQRQIWTGFPFANWRNNYFHTSTYDGRKNQLSHLEQVWSTSSSAWVNNHMYDFSYNNYNQLTSHKSNTWNAGGFWFPTTTDYYNRYYYEEYGSTGVANKENTQAELKLYPVPAMGTMNMDLKWSTAQSATIAIFDMHGRVMSQWQLSSTDTYHKSIDVSQMPAGIYILKVQGAKDATIQQFTVAH